MRSLRGIRRTAVRFLECESGATAVEYALVAVGISIAIAVTVKGIGSNLKTNFYEKVQNATAN